MTDPYVLVVEDDDAIRTSLHEALADEDLLVRVAANGREALEVLSSHGAAAVVLLDLMMPVMDGESFLRRQRSDPGLAKMPIVLMTASELRDLGRLAVTALLRKPFSIDQLLEKLAPWIHQAG